VIGSLRGRLLHRGAGEVLVEVAGVGYVVVTSPTTVVALGEVGDEVFVWIHHHLREDAETLYGFGSRDERVTFDALLGAHGVGPALALAILSIHAPAALARILAEDDVAVAGERSATTDVREALAGLGYSADEIRSATAELAPDGDAAAMLRAALQHLAGRR